MTIFGSLFGPLGNLHLHYPVQSLRCRPMAN